MTHRRPTKNRNSDLEPDCLHRNRTSWRMTHRRPTKNRDPDLELLGWNQELVSLAGSGNLSAWLDPGTCQEPELDWNSKGRTVQNNTPCCGSRPPAYPSFYTDGHVFRRVKHRRSLGHQIDSAREYSLGAEKMVDSSGTGFQDSETR